MNRKSLIINDNVTIASSWFFTITLIIFFVLIQIEHPLSDLLSFNGIIFILVTLLPFIVSLTVTLNSKVRRFYATDMTSMLPVYFTASFNIMGNYDDSVSSVEMLITLIGWSAVEILIYMLIKRSVRKKG